jgi:hypothetical protein
MTHGRAQRQTVTIGGRRDGTVTAYRLEILQDAGAYPRMGAFMPALSIMLAGGPYAIPRAEAVATSVVTNTTPVGAYRGAGQPEATAALERATHPPQTRVAIDVAASLSSMSQPPVIMATRSPAVTRARRQTISAWSRSGPWSPNKSPLAAKAASSASSVTPPSRRRSRTAPSWSHGPSDSISAIRRRGRAQ